jgi:hypothetical protein
MTFGLLDIDLIWDWRAKELGIAYLPGLEAVGTPLLLDEGHVGVEVVVHLEVGTLLVDDFDVVSIDVRILESPGGLTGGGCGHLCGYG